MKQRQIAEVVENLKNIFNIEHENEGFMIFTMVQGAKENIEFNTSIVASEGNISYMIQNAMSDNEDIEHLFLAACFNFIHMKDSEEEGFKKRCIAMLKEKSSGESINVYFTEDTFAKKTLPFRFMSHSDICTYLDDIMGGNDNWHHYETIKN